MVVMGEARGTPSYLSPAAMQSPRYGGCVSAFFHLFDWTSAKRFSSAKRLRAAASNKAEKPGSFRRSRSFRADHGKTRMRYDEMATSTRPPGVVARLMGLDSLPNSAPRHSSHPVLLQDLLKHDYKAPKSTTKSLRDRLFTKRAHRQYKPGRALTVFRCRSEEWCISPAFVDVPQPVQSRSFMYAMTQKQKPFLSRLPPSSLHGEQIPELSLLQARFSGRDILLQGWPLAGQHNVPRDLYHETETSSSEDQQQESVESIGSKPTDSTASSKPLLTNYSKVVQGRRRSSSWNGSDDGSESTIDSHRRIVVKKAAVPLQSQHRRSKPLLTDNPEFKSSRHRGSSRSSPSDRFIPVEISKTSASHVSTGTLQSSSIGELQSKALQGRGSRAGRPDRAKFTNNSSMKNASSTTTKVKSKPEHLGTVTERSPGKPPPDRAKGKGSHGIHHLPKSSLLSHSKLLKEESFNKPKLQRFTEKAAASGVGVCTDRLKTGNAAQDQSGEPVVSNSKRTKQSQARSVDALFPELPLESCESTETRQPVLFSPDCESTETLQPVGRVLFSPDFDFTECTEISASPLIDYDELCDSGEYGKERQGISGSPLIDCDDLRGENESISVVSYHEVHWEDEIVETILSGRCCERNCSGPSISSRSVTFSDEERNGDSWSSCASYNPGDCSDSLSDSPRINFQVKELDVEAEVLHQEPKSPPSQFVQKKSLEESLVDEAAGQPSPVSVLQSPFHDETCTTSESSPESIGQKRSDESEEREPPTVSNSDRIKQALLDISMFRIRDDCTCEHTASAGELHLLKDEQSFIREVLSAANFLATPGSSPNWHDKDLAIDPSLFDRLESEGVALASGGLWRCDRKLLFDCVNEAFGHLWHLHREVWAPELVWRLSGRPRGPQLVLTVVKKIEEWRKLASFAIDSLIERDMSVHLGTWKFIGPEIAEVVVEIESLVWTGILDEVVVDIVKEKYGTNLADVD